MNKMISKRAERIKPSVTLAVTAKAKALKKQGVDIVNFAAGELDFDTPENIKQAGKKAIDEGKTRYTPVPGMPELREAVAAKFKRENNIEYSPDEVLISCGGKHSLANIFLAILNKDDEVIVPKPYWVSYPSQVELADGKAIYCECDEMQLNAEMISEKISEKTKAIILNSPSNPSGAVIDEEELKKIADLAVKNNIYVISDEVYEHMVYEGKHTSIASLGEEIKKLTFVVNSVSKTYSMTGWRIGYCAGPIDVIKKMSAIQGNMTSNPCSIAQHAALEALNGDQSFVVNMKKELVKRRDYMFGRLSTMEKLSCEKPQGAFYLFFDISKTGLNSLEFCEKLLDEAQIAGVPGIAFGVDNCVRFSYACSIDEIKKGMDKLEQFLKSL